jgi:glycine/D-amino acid oxidase-like deaminating enzyme
MQVVICGGGVIGAAVACFLSRRGVAATVVERTGLACAASGKSGGFLALDWCDGTPLEALARRSFALHAELAAELPSDIGYRRLTTYGGVATETTLQRRGGEPRPWLSERVALGRRLGTPETTAQVHPQGLTAALMRAAEARGAKHRTSRVVGIARAGGRTAGVVVDGETLPAEAIVIAMGPWSILATEWLPLPPVYGLKGHSIVFETGTKIPAEALFLEYRAADGSTHSPEIFPRPDGTTWCCAMSSDAPLPIDPAEVAPDPGAMQRLEALCRSLSPALADAPIVARQACFHPVTEDGLPLIGAIPGLDGAYVATAHSVWGILNAPATGEAMAELIVDGEAEHVDLAPFAPGRLRPFDASRLRMAAR